MNEKRPQISVMNDIVKDEKGYNIVYHIFAHKPDGLLVIYIGAYIGNIFRRRRILPLRNLSFVTIMKLLP